MRSFTISEPELWEDSFEGICLNCGNRQHGVEPDAENYSCESCGSKSVYGLEQAVICGFVGITE